MLIQGTVKQGGKAVGARVDAMSHGLLVMQLEHGMVHAQKHFTLIYSVADIGAMTTPDDMITLSFTTPTLAQNPNLIHILFGGYGSSSARIRFIEGKTGGGASPTGSFTPVNSDRSATVAASIYDLAGTPVVNKVSYDATLFTGGTTLSDIYVGSDGVGFAFVPGSAVRENELILKRGTSYQLSLFDTSAVPAVLVMNWYETIAEDAI